MPPSFVPQTADNRHVTKFFLMLFNTSYFYIVHIYLLLKLHLTLFLHIQGRRLQITRTLGKRASR